MAYQTFQQEYMQMPPVTRAYTTACVITTILVVSYLSYSYCENHYNSLCSLVSCKIGVGALKHRSVE